KIPRSENSGCLYCNLRPSPSASGGPTHGCIPGKRLLQRMNLSFTIAFRAWGAGAGTGPSDSQRTKATPSNLLVSPYNDDTMPPVESPRLHPSRSQVLPTSSRSTPLLGVWLRDLIISLGISAFIIIFLYQPVKVEGTSMMPSLDDQERIFVNKFVY